MEYTFDGQEMLTRLVKYLILGLTIGLVAWLLPTKALSGAEVAYLALTAASIFAVLDLLAPAISGSAMQGVGLATGVSLIGLP